jgi:hypothetical protein
MRLTVEEVALGSIVRLLNRTPGVVDFGVDFQKPTKANGAEPKSKRASTTGPSLRLVDVIEKLAEQKGDLAEVAKVLEVGSGLSLQQVRKRIGVHAWQLTKLGLAKKVKDKPGFYILTAKGLAKIKQGHTEQGA